MIDEKRIKDNAAYRAIYDMIQSEIKKSNEKINIMFEKLFIGNGKPSWSSRIDAIEKSLENFAKQQDKEFKTNKFFWMKLGIFSSIIFSAFSLFWKW